MERTKRHLLVLREVLLHDLQRREDLVMLLKPVRIEFFERNSFLGVQEEDHTSDVRVNGWYWRRHVNLQISVGGCVKDSSLNLKPFM